jgi:hypothetical protein
VARINDVNIAWVLPTVNPVSGATQPRPQIVADQLRVDPAGRRPQPVPGLQPDIQPLTHGDQAQVPINIRPRPVRASLLGRHPRTEPTPPQPATLPTRPRW